MQYGYQCGMIWGSALASGAEAYKHFGAGSKAQAAAIKTSGRVVEKFMELKNTINCMEITELDHTSSNMQTIMYFFVKGGTIGCIKMANKFAPIAFKEISESFAENSFVEPEKPVSCTSILAEKAGLSEEQVTIAAGLAGGIGLCGGACGALATAIWINALTSMEENEGKVEFKDPKGLELIEKFTKLSDYQFECAEIVGRKFIDVNDHSEYLHNGGCSEILEQLLSELNS